MFHPPSKSMAGRIMGSLNNPHPIYRGWTQGQSVKDCAMTSHVNLADSHLLPGLSLSSEANMPGKPWLCLKPF